MLALDGVGQRRVVLFDNPMSEDRHADGERSSCFADSPEE